MADEVHVATLALNIRELCWRARPKGAYSVRKEEWPTILQPDEASRVFREAVKNGHCSLTRHSGVRTTVAFTCIMDLCTVFQVEPFFFAKYL